MKDLKKSYPLLDPNEEKDSIARRGRMRQSVRSAPKDLTHHEGSACGFATKATGGVTQFKFLPDVEECARVCKANWPDCQSFEYGDSGPLTAFTCKLYSRAATKLPDRSYMTCGTIGNVPD